jgi:hypothetical protein
MRIYLPATLVTLADLHKSGEHGPAPITGFAVTPALREWYTDEDEDELEYAAFRDAAVASLRLLDADPTAPRRRVVLSADVPDGEVRPHPELDRSVVRVSVPTPIEWFAAVHVDSADAVPDVTAAAQAIGAADLGDDDAQFAVDGAEAHELEWYGLQEVPDLIS